MLKSIMGSLKICRVCFITGVSMYTLQGETLRTFSKLIIGDCIHLPEIPQYLCYECIHLLKKYYGFWQRGQKAHKLLSEVVQYNNEIPENFGKMNRKLLNLTSALTEHKTVIGYQYIFKYEGPDDKLGNETAKQTLPSDNFGKADSKYLNAFKYEELDHQMEKTTGNKRCEHTNHPMDYDKNTAHCIDTQAIQDDSDKNNCSVFKITTNLTGHKCTDVDSFKYEGIESELEIQRAIDDDLNVLCENNSNDIEQFSTIIDNDQNVINTEFQTEVDMKEHDVMECTEYKNAEDAEGNDLSLKIEPFLTYDFTIVDLSCEEQLKEIEQRRESENYKFAQYKCEHCARGFQSSYTFNNHQKKHDFSFGNLECRICKLRYRNKKALRSHLTKQHIKKYSCNRCLFVCTDSEGAKKHKYEHDGLEYKCDICGMTLKKYTSYLSHKRLQHPSQYICVNCGFSFLSENGLKKHRKLIHAESTTPVRGDASLYCGMCQLQFVSNEAYRCHFAHAARHYDATDKTKRKIDYQCRICLKIWDSRSDLLQHKKLVHPRTIRKYDHKHKPNKGIKCELCNEEFQSKAKRWGHYRRVHKNEKYPFEQEKTVVCETCGKTFLNEVLYRYHVRRHTGDKPYKCQQCPKQFFDPCQLRRHSVVHGDALHTCAVCGKGFNIKSNLLRHKVIHLDTRPYSCEMCGKGYNDSDTLLRHRRSVHGDQPWAIGKKRQRQTTNTPRLSTSLVNKRKTPSDSD